MNVSRYTINQLVNDKRNLTAEMALRLGAATSTSPEFWLNLQRAVELFDARAELDERLKEVKVVLTPASEEPFTPSRKKRPSRSLTGLVVGAIVSL
jgi:antitoxin HigA-1